MSAALRVEGLAKSFGARKVFAGISLSVAPGEVVALLGPSGSGKTTLFRCIARLVAADAGNVQLMGNNLTVLQGRKLYRARRDIALIYQQFNLVRRLTAIENVLIGRLHEIATWRVLSRHFSSHYLSLAWNHLERVGLADHAFQRADQLSGGQQQRVAIARALMQESRVMLADEPVSNLDPVTAESILALLRSVAKEHGIALLCSLHQPQYVQQVADRALHFAPSGQGVTEPELSMPAAAYAVVTR